MKRSLGVMLALCLAGLQFLAVLMVVFSSYISSEQALMQHARDLLRDVGQNSIAHVRGFLTPARSQAELAVRLAQHRIIASDDAGQMEQLLFQQLQMAPQLAGLYFGAPDGRFIMVMRDPTGPAPFRSKIIEPDAGPERVKLIWRDDRFTEIATRLEPEDTYDPRSRSWYINASAMGGTLWADPYIFFSSQQPGITLASPILQADGDLQGVIGVDIEIGQISEFLAGLSIGKNGRAMIVHNNGDVIAHPQLDLIKTRDADNNLTFARIHELQDPIARSAFVPLAAEHGLRVDTETQLQFSYAGARYVAILMPIISDMLPWTIAVYAPEADFTQTVIDNRTFNIWIAALVAVLTGLIGLVLAERLHRPVKAFAVRSSLIAQGEIDPSQPAPLTYRELDAANQALVQQIVARRQAERQYGQTFELANRSMAQIAAHDGRILRANSSFAQLLGYCDAELLQMRLADLLHPDEPQSRITGVLEDAPLNPDQPLRLLNRQGETVWGLLNAIMIRDVDGAFLHSVITLDDISTQRAQELQIDQLSRDLAHMARGHTIGQLASGLAHELNQPLAAIANNADSALLTLQKAGQSAPELREILTEIEAQSLRAGEIINALRGFIRKEEGHRQEIDFENLFIQTRSLLKAELGEARIQLRADLQGLPQVLGNRVQIAQVLVNLLRNAVEAIASDDTPNAPRQICVTAQTETGYLRVEVCDTGPGISPGVALFTEFETTKPGGMGLGLSICRSIIERNGGKLWAVDHPGRGACFNFTLEIAAPPHSNA